MRRSEPDQHSRLGPQIHQFPVDADEQFGIELFHLQAHLVAAPLASRHRPLRSPANGCVIRRPYSGRSKPSTRVTSTTCDQPVNPIRTRGRSW